jgi:hypothetical protein
MAFHGLACRDTDDTVELFGPVPGSRQVFVEGCSQLFVCAAFAVPAGWCAGADFGFFAHLA